MLSLFMEWNVFLGKINFFFSLLKKQGLNKIFQSIEIDGIAFVPEEGEVVCW